MARTLVVAVAAALLLLATRAVADPPGGRGRHGHDRDYDRRDDRRDGADIVITAVERALIHDYYRDTRRDDGYDSLPPGIRKNLARGKPLPPGIAKKMPDDLRHRLPYREGYDYRVVGADVLLVELATGAIVDILRGALR